MIRATASGIDHVGVASSDIERSLGFYRDALGMALLGRGREASADMAALLGVDAVEFEYADLDAGDGRVLELLRFAQPQGEQVAPRPFDPGTAHIGVRVDDLDGVAARLGDAVISRAAVRVDDPGSYWHGGRFLYVRDPDGTIVELVERPSA